MTVFSVTPAGERPGVLSRPGNGDGLIWNKAPGRPFEWTAPASRETLETLRSPCMSDKL